MSARPWTPAAILFDLDGTLVDSAADLAGALNAVLTEHGLPTLSLGQVRALVGHGVRALVQRGFAAQGRPLDDGALTQATAAFMAQYAPRATRETRLYPFVRETIQSLSARGTPLAVCTNKPTAVSRQILAYFGLGDAFQAVVGGDFDGLPRKPDPALLRRACALLGTVPEASLMVGDSAADVAAARAAPMPVLVVAHGYTQTRPEALGAQGVIEDFSGLEDAIAALGSTLAMRAPTS